MAYVLFELPLICLNVFVIDLSTSGFLAARIVAGLEIGNFIPATIDIRNEVSFGDLLMVDIEQDFAGRRVDCLANSVCLI